MRHKNYKIEFKVNYKKLKIILFSFLLATFFCNCNTKRKKLEYLLTKDSIQYFDSFILSEGKKTAITSFSFDKDGNNERYHFRIYDDKRHLFPYFNEPDIYGTSNKWKILNDSMIQMMGTNTLIIERYTEDSIFLRSIKNKDYLEVLVRIKEDPKIDLNSIKQRDSLYIEFKKMPKVEVIESNN